MINQYIVRYGRNYKLGLAIVLPSLLLVPFIIFLSAFKSLQEWMLWLIIFGFLGIVISLSMWLVFRVYPLATIIITQNEISLLFKRSGLPGPSDFSIYISDIHSFTRHQIGGNDYFLFETRNPFRKFQVSAASDSLEDIISFYEAMSELGEKVEDPKEL